MVNPLFFGIGIIVIFLLLDSIPKFGFFISHTFLGVLFLFTSANYSAEVGTFYSIMILLTFVFGIVNKIFQPEEVTSISLFGFKLNRLGVILFGVGIGVAMFFIINAIFFRNPEAAIFGVPKTLAATGNLKNMGPALTGMLGIVENRFFFGLYLMLKRFSKVIITSSLGLFPIVGQASLPFVAVIIPLIPIILIPAGFALFHLTAYGVAIGNLIFAAVAMLFMILVFDPPVANKKALSGELAPNIFHFVHNFVVTLGRGLQIV